ncbi:MAG: metallophosphoesterase, partial [Armatimonadetes bacterium]|nr:metallophosphoesterase [Anaerolineae bacterium]
MGVNRLRDLQDPMTDSRFHKVLVFTAQLQQLPSVLVGIWIMLCTGICALAWAHAPLLPLLYAGFAALNWWLMWSLPRFGLSFGPEKATVMALALLLLALVMPLGLLGAPLWMGLAVLVITTALAVYATYVEPFDLRVTHETLITPKWSSSAPLTVLHIADIQVERITKRERLLNQRIRELKPDVIVFSGDFVSISYRYDANAQAAIREVIAEWDAPYGVYCVPGTYTVEPIERVQQFVAGLGNLRLLLDQWVTINTPGGILHIMGMVTRHILATDQATVARMMRTAPDGGVKLLLTHAPDVAPDADAAGIDLYLCGHTHGGQIRLP